MNLLVLLHSHLTLNPLLVVPQILLKIFKFSPLFTTFQGPLSLSLIVLFFHHLIVFEHVFLHHHVHILLQESASLFHVCMIIQLLLHLDLLLFRLKVFFLLLLLLFKVLKASKHGPFIHRR